MGYRPQDVHGHHALHSRQVPLAEGLVDICKVLCSVCLRALSCLWFLFSFVLVCSFK
jgi:hypothetical protein